MQSYRVIIIFGLIVIGFIVFMFVSGAQANNDPATKLTNDFITAYKANDAAALKLLVDPNTVEIKTDTNNRILSTSCKKINFGGAFAQMPDVTYTYQELIEQINACKGIVPDIFTNEDYSSVSYNHIVTFYYKRPSPSSNYKLIYIALKQEGSPNED